MYSYNPYYAQYLAHHGVMGMKWGIRKQRDPIPISNYTKQRIKSGLKKIAIGLALVDPIMMLSGHGAVLAPAMLKFGKTAVKSIKVAPKFLKAILGKKSGAAAATRFSGAVKARKGMYAVAKDAYKAVKNTAKVSAVGLGGMYAAQKRLLN